MSIGSLPATGLSIARHTFAAVVVSIAALAGSLTASSASGAPLAQIGEARPIDGPTRLPRQGLYEGCAPGTESDACIARLETIRSAGFHYVLNYSAWYAPRAEVKRYADAAAALGLRLIWPLNNPAWRGIGSLRATYSTFALDPNRRRRREPGFIAKAIGLVAKHPATWGFYIGDELPLTEVSRTKWLSAIARRLAPDKPQLYVARPGVRRLRPFAFLADFAGVDPYPVGSCDPPVGVAARSARIAASAAGARTVMVLQAFSWSQYQSDRPPRYPSTATLRAMRDAAIVHGRPAMILWYSYQDILRSDDPKRRWLDLAQAAFSPLDFQSDRVGLTRSTQRSACKNQRTGR